jgi:hypothetical protein
MLRASRHGHRPAAAFIKDVDEQVAKKREKRGPGQ